MKIRFPIKSADFFSWPIHFQSFMRRLGNRGCLLLSAFAFLSTNLLSVEPEKITLDDGRILIGIYDANANTITLTEGKVHATIKLRRDSIKKRETIEAASPPEKELKPLSLPLEKSTTDSVLPEKPRPNWLDARKALMEGQSRLIEQARAKEQEAIRLGIEFDRSFLLSADLRPAAVPALANDPKISEKERYEQILRMNQALTDLRSLAQSRDFESRQSYRWRDEGKSSVWHFLETYHALWLSTRSSIKP
jgi:hypothetical protein